MVFLSKQSLHLRRLIVSALFLAAALTVRQFTSFYLPVFGAGGMRVGLSPIFSIPPALLFGPFYGLLVSGLNDFIGFFLRPTGTYLPHMTILMAAIGFLRGIIWPLIKNISAFKLRIGAIIFAAIMLIFAVTTIIMLRIDGIDENFYYGIDYPAEVDTSDMTIMGRFLIVRSQTVSNPTNTLTDTIVNLTRLPIVFAGFFVVLLIVEFLISKFLVKTEERQKALNIMPLLITMLVTGLIMSTFNTIIIRQHVFTSWQEMPFVVVWLPRATLNVLTYAVYTYIIAVLMEVCNRVNFIKPLIWQGFKK